ncbi:hypothetical protein C8J57DRAFT_1498815 [Mycena rebaudengoi]|nr:hypothetical protein C8J57DRAFT_1498815 [Mycena rebaudengoi]
MGGAKLRAALMYNAHADSTGVLIHQDGRVSSVPDDKWEEIEQLVRDAKRVITELDISCWSRPQYGSCPVSHYYDLGPPSEGVEELNCFQLTGHQVEDRLHELMARMIDPSIPPIPQRPKDPKDGILAYKKRPDGTYGDVIVDEIPEAITKLKAALGKLQEDDLQVCPTFFGNSLSEKDIKAMLFAIGSMSSPIAHERSSMRARRKQGWWFGF